MANSKYRQKLQASPLIHQRNEKRLANGSKFVNNDTQKLLRKNREKQRSHQQLVNNGMAAAVDSDLHLHRSRSRNSRNSSGSQASRGHYNNQNSPLTFELESYSKYGDKFDKRHQIISKQ